MATKQQTHISIFEDRNGRTIDFERWSTTSDRTAVNKVRALYKKYSWMIPDKFEILKVYRTNSAGDKLETVTSIGKKDFAEFLG